MNTFKKLFVNQPLLAGVGLASLLVLAAGCSTDSPTAPGQGGQNPGDGQGSNQWVITVTASPSTIELANNNPTSVIGVSVVNSSTGAAPPEGTLFQLKASLGSFGGDQTITGTLSFGRFSTLYTAITPGNDVISATLERSVGQKVIQVLHPDESGFALTHMEPNVGNPAGGQVATLFGINIREPVKVTFGSDDAEILGVTPTRIRVRVPPSSTPVPVGTTRTVSVTAISGFNTQFSATDTIGGGYVYSHGGTGTFPQVFSLEPDNGPTAGGTTVVARGSGFGSNVRVMMQAQGGPVIELQQINSSSTVVTFLTPNAASLAPSSSWNGDADVWIIDLTSGLSSNKVVFHYGATIFVSSVIPAVGNPAGGETVEILGSGFDTAMQVFFGTAEQTVLSVTPTKITVRTAPAPVGVCTETQLPVKVRSILTGVESSGNLMFTYQSGSPLVASVAPSSASHGGGGIATISGSGFGSGGGGVVVRFGTSTSGSTTVNSSSSITASIPASGTSPEACDENGDGINGSRFIAQVVGITVVNLPQGCTGTAGGAFTYLGTPCNEVALCNNGIDDDGDTFIDFPADPGCTSPTDNTE